MRDFAEERNRPSNRLTDMVRNFLKRIRRRGEPELPEDPHAYVTAPKKPRPNQGSAAAILELPED